jgi:2-iminobutanoate/2-iminopropanoate deaminase
LPTPSRWDVRLLAASGYRSFVMKEAIATEDAPKAIGPYSQALRAGDWVFCSGQLGLDPQSGNLVDGVAGTQAVRALENLRAVLSAAGCGFEDVVRTTIYLTDMADYAAVNEVYARYFRAPFPARVTVQVAALPRSAAVEIDAVGFKPR